MKRLIQISENEYAYRRMYSPNVMKVSAEELDKIYRKHFPAAERTEENVLLALDIETSVEVMRDGRVWEDLRNPFTFVPDKGWVLREKA